MSKVIPFPVKSNNFIIPSCSGRSMPVSEVGNAITRFCLHLAENHGDRSVLVIQGDGEIRIRMRRGENA